MTDVMVDLETMGLTPDGAICSIGACYFDIRTGEIGPTFECNVDLESALGYGMKVTASTIEWWLGQSEEARDALFKDTLSLPIALSRFRDFARGKFSLWSHATFDAVILDRAFELTHVPRPWHYRDVRDIRTLTYMWKSLTGSKVPIQMKRPGHHKALDDAIYQAGYCYRMFDEIEHMK